MKNAQKNRYSLRKSCKAQESTMHMLFILSEIILVIAAGFLVFGKITSIDNNQLFLKKFYSRDVALTLDAIQALPGNLLYFYAPPSPTKDSLPMLSKLAFKFTPTSVEADDAKYPVSANVDETIIEKAEQFVITKGNNKIMIKKLEKPSEKPVFNPNKINCAQTEARVTGTIAIDPGHGYNSKTTDGDYGERGVKGVESEMMFSVSQALEGALKVNGFTVQKTRDTQDDARTIQQRQEKIASAEILLSLHANKDIPEINALKAYVNYDSEKYEESVKLACLILNELSEKFTMQTTGASIIPINPAQLDKEDSKQFLDKSKVAVQIELGNIDGASSYITNFADVGNAITTAVGLYNKK